MYQNQPFTRKLEKLKFTTFFYKIIQKPITKKANKNSVT